MPDSYLHLSVETRDDGICTVRIQREEVLNALNDATLDEIESCFEAIAADPACQLVIVTGAGKKAFVAGADISELASQGPLEARQRSQRGQRAFSRIEQLGKPVIAAINGFALGGGLELALSCHLRYASENAKLGLPEVGLGIIPGYGGTQRLPRLIGAGRALEWILSGEMLNVHEAYRVGLLNGVFPPDDLLSQVEEVATKILSRGPVAVSLALDSVLRGRDVTLTEGLSVESDLFGIASATEDMKEGMQAFLEKRAARFQGK